MKKLIRIYVKLLHLNLLSLVLYRAHFFSSLLASVGWGVFSLYSVVLLTSKTQSVFGWQRDELLFLNGLYGIIVGTFHVIFSRNFERISSVIHLGHLDQVLLKPVDSQFLLSFWLFGYATISRVIIAVVYTAVIANALHLQIRFDQFIGFLLLMVVSLTTLYSLWFLLITSTMWFTKLSNLIELMFTLTGSARYPQEILRQLSEYVFIFFLPLTLIITIPAKVYLQKVQSIDIVWLILFSFILFIVSRKFWKFALRFYTSASS